jgi:hypothetical protein
MLGKSVEITHGYEVKASAINPNEIKTAAE